MMQIEAIETLTEYLKSDDGAKQLKYLWEKHKDRHPALISIYALGYKLIVTELQTLFKVIAPQCQRTGEPIDLTNSIQALRDYLETEDSKQYVETMIHIQQNEPRNKHKGIYNAKNAYEDCHHDLIAWCNINIKYLNRPTYKKVGD